MSTKKGLVLSVVMGVLLFVLLYVAISFFKFPWEESGGQFEPEARGSVWATKAYTTSTMTISSSAITISNTGFGWSATDVTDAEVAVISSHDAGIVITWDGNTPTAAHGRPIITDTTVTIKGSVNVGNLQFIRSGGGDAVVSVTFEK